MHISFIVEYQYHDLSCLENNAVEVKYDSYVEISYYSKNKNGQNDPPNWSEKIRSNLASCICLVCLAIV